MLKIYRIECGAPTNYTSVKPKFCSGCGNSFGKTVVNKVLMQKPIADKPQPPKRILPKVQLKSSEDSYEDDDDDFDEVNHVPNINSLDCEIDETRQRKTKIGDIIGSSKNQPKREKTKSKPVSKAERKKFLEDFKREAGSLRPKSRGRQDG